MKPLSQHYGELKSGMKLMTSAQKGCGGALGNNNLGTEAVSRYEWQLVASGT